MMIRLRCLVFFFHAKHHPAPPCTRFKLPLHVTSSDSAKNIGAVLDSTLSFDNHVMQICKSSFYAIRNISCIRKFSSIQTAMILVHAFVTSKLNSCNSLLYSLPKNILQHLQYVLNSAAMSRIQIMLLLIELHWLPIEQGIEFKVLLFKGDARLPTSVFM